MKLEIVPQPKQVEQPTRNWVDLPSELTANILHRIGVVDILRSAQKVCTAWREICKDPAMWRVVYMDTSSDPNGDLPLDEMCKHVVDRSQGQLVDITMVKFGYGKILEYIANRSSQLKRLTIKGCAYNLYYDNWAKYLKQLPLLEELSLWVTAISKEGIETVGRYCPMLKTLKLNQQVCRFLRYDSKSWEPKTTADRSSFDEVIAAAIGKNLHELRHLELIGASMSDYGLGMILDGCHHLESLDLRGCFVNLDGGLGKRCSQKIKCLKLPHDSLEGYPYIYYGLIFDFGDDFDDEFDDEFDGRSEAD